MADDPGQDPTGTTPDPQAGADGKASDDGTTSAATAQDAPQPTGDPKTDDELRRARDDAAKYRTQLREAQKALEDAQTALKAKDDEGKSELQKAMDRVQELEGRFQLADRQVRELRLQNTVITASMDKGIVDPDAAFRLLDKDGVEYDGDRPTNVSDLLDALIEQKPYLKAASKDAPKGGKGGSSSPTQPANPGGRKLTMEDIQQMTSAEINARWDEVQPVLAASKGH